MRAFLSSSFAPEDKPVIDRFTTLVSQLGVQVYQAHMVPEILSGLIAKIKEHDSFIAILTPRKTDQPPEYVSFEMAAALTADKHPLIFRQEDVPVQPIYGHLQQIAFNRARLLAKDPAEEEMIKNVVREHYAYYGRPLTDADPEVDRRYEFAKSQALMLGSRILGYFNNALHRNAVRDATIKNYPTDADVLANGVIVRALQDDGLTRQDGIVTEEWAKNVEDVRRTMDSHEFVWIVDPLDGTLNFAYRFPFFCVSLSLLRNKVPTLGVLYSPTTQELYCGRAGSQSERISLRSGRHHPLLLDSPKQELSDCIVMTHLSTTNAEARSATIGILDDLVATCRSVRMLGSGQMALAGLALGQFDLFFNYRTHVWDIVPGLVILRGASGYVTGSLDDDDNKGWDWQSRGIIAAANRTTGEKFRKFLRRKLRDDLPRYC